MCLKDNSSVEVKKFQIEFNKKKILQISSFDVLILEIYYEKDWILCIQAICMESMHKLLNCSWLLMN